MDYILFTDQIVDPPPLLDFGYIPINSTNIHSGLWCVLHTISDDDELSEDERNILKMAKSALDDFIVPEILCEILQFKNWTYELDPSSIIAFAEELILINKEAKELYNAQRDAAIEAAN